MDLETRIKITRGFIARDMAIFHNSNDGATLDNRELNNLYKRVSENRAALEQLIKTREEGATDEA